jgi:hypothetical protein
MSAPGPPALTPSTRGRVWRSSAQAGRTPCRD